MCRTFANGSDGTRTRDLRRDRSAVAHLQSRGVDVEEGPVARDGARGSGTSVYFRDPDGSLLELISYTR